MGAIFTPLAVPGLALSILCRAVGVPVLGIAPVAHHASCAYAAHQAGLSAEQPAFAAASKAPRMVVRDFSQFTSNPKSSLPAVLAAEPVYVVPSVVDNDPVFYARLKPQAPAAQAAIIDQAQTPPQDTRPQPASDLDYSPKPVAAPAFDTNPSQEQTPEWRNASVSLQDQEMALFAMVNRERQERGLQVLTLSPLLCRVARAHSEDMCRRNYFDHIAPAPSASSPMDRYLAAVGARPNRAMVGENIYYRSITDSVGVYAAQAHDAFMHSPGHRANILTPQYDQGGIGIYRNPETGEFWVTEEFLTVSP